MSFPVRGQSAVGSGPIPPLGRFEAVDRPAPEERARQICERESERGWIVQRQIFV